MNIEELFAGVGLTLRDIQKEYFDAVSAGMSCSGRVALLSADTGVGKTLSYLVSALKILEKDPLARFIIATSSHVLMNQIMGSDRTLIEKMAADASIQVSFSRLLGKSNYVSQDKVRNVRDTYPQNSSDDIRILNALAEWNGPLVEFLDEYGELPVGVKPEMVTYSVWDNAVHIRDMQHDALKSNFVVTTHAMVIIDSLCKGVVLGEKSDAYLIIDEADLFTDLLEQWQQRRLNMHDLLSSSIGEHFSRKSYSEIQAIASEIVRVADGIHFNGSAAATELYSEAIDTLISAGKTIRDNSIRENFTNTLFSWEMAKAMGCNTGVGVSKIRQEPAIININPFIGLNIGKYCTQWRSTLMTSATLSITNNPEKGMEWIVKSLGLTEDIISLKDIFSPETYGQMTLTLAGAEFPDIFSNAKEQVFSDAWLNGVTDVIRKSSTPLVVITASHSEGRAIVNTLGDISAPVHLQRAGQPLSEIVKIFRENPGVLISAGAGVGLNLRNHDGSQMFHELIITRMRFSPPDKEGVESYYQYLKSCGYTRSLEALTSKIYVSQLQKVVRHGKQSIGRGIRSESDVIHVTILDPRFPEPKDISSRHRVLENIFPARFGQAYRTCKILSPAKSAEDIEC